MAGKKTPKQYRMDAEIEATRPLKNRMHQILKGVKSTRPFTGYIKQRTNSLPIQTNPSKKQWTVL